MQKIVKLFRRLKWRGGWSYLGFLGLALFGVYLGVQGNRAFRNDGPEITHGPRLNILTPQMLSTASKETQPPPPPPAAAKPKVAAPKAVAGRAGYGIAAGGGLTYVGQPELDQYFTQLKELGVGWVRWDIDWSFVQPDGPGSYRWEEIDRVANTANKFGIQSLAIITYAPAWARNPACSNELCAPKDPGTFGQFAGAVAARYKGRIATYEIWNEPNFDFFWQPAPNMDEYKNILVAAFGQIKTADPSATVIAGSLAAVGDDDGNIAPITFVKGLYARGAQAYFDAVSVHPYSYPAPPSHVAWWNRWQQIVPIHDFMVSQGQGHKKVWLTEVGAPTDGPGASHTTAMGSTYNYGSDFMSEAAQDVIMQEVLRYHGEYSAWAGPMFWYSLKDTGTSKNTPENFFGLLRYDGSKKPAYTTFQNALK